MSLAATVAYLHSLLAERGFLNSMDLITMEAAYTSPGYRLNYHLSVLLGLTSILWSGHLVHVAVPYSRASGSLLHLVSLFKGDWTAYSLKSDIVHHHLALGAVTVWSAHVYSSIYISIGHRMRDISSASALSVLTSSSSIWISMAG